MKTCKICKVEKSLNYFPYHGSSKDKKSSHCFSCQEVERLKFIESNPLRICNSCNIEKVITDFPKVNGLKGFSYKCKQCNKERCRVYREQNPDKIKEYRSTKDYKKRAALLKKSNIKSNPLPTMLHRAKQRAKKKGIEFNISKEDIELPEYCPLLNIKLEVGEAGNYDNAPSIDRIDSSKGYIKGNVWVISSLANTMKNKATLEQLKLFAKNIIKIL